jgi:hypothetical protein
VGRMAKPLKPTAARDPGRLGQPRQIANKAKAMPVSPFNTEPAPIGDPKAVTPPEGHSAEIRRGDLWPPPLARASRSRATGAAAVALKARAARAALAIIKSRAQTFARIPALLDNIEPELSILTPRQMAARAAQLFRNELAMPRGFGGEVPAMNLKAAAWYGRYLRAKESQLRRRRAQ